MMLTEEQQKKFQENQTQDRNQLRFIQEAFDGFDSVARLTDAIGDHHFFKGDETRFAKEIRLLGFDEALDNFLCRCAALEHSEVSETLEEGRLENRSYLNLLEEQADVIIRTLNLMTNLVRLGKENDKLDKSVSIGNIIYAKTAKNIERPPSHGGKRF